MPTRGAARGRERGGGRAPGPAGKVVGRASGRGDGLPRFHGRKAETGSDAAVAPVSPVLLERPKEIGNGPQGRRHGTFKKRADDDPVFPFRVAVGQLTKSSGMRGSADGGLNGAGVVERPLPRQERTGGREGREEGNFPRRGEEATWPRTPEGACRPRWGFLASPGSEAREVGFFAPAVSDRRAHRCARWRLRPAVPAARQVFGGRWR